jgi:hypothetical protein
MRGRSNGEIDKDSRSLPPCSPSPLIPPQYSHPPPFSTIVSATIIRRHRQATTPAKGAVVSQQELAQSGTAVHVTSPYPFPRGDGQPERRGWASFGGKVVVPHSPTTANPERHDHRGSQSCPAGPTRQPPHQPAKPTTNAPPRPANQPGRPANQPSPQLPSHRQNPALPRQPAKPATPTGQAHNHLATSRSPRPPGQPASRNPNRLEPRSSRQSRHYQPGSA